MNTTRETVPVAVQDQAQAPASCPARRLAAKYLTFFLGDEEYACNIRTVQEIVGMMDITPVPHAPAYAKGVTNLRGRVIPVMDLRSRLGMPAAEQTPRTCIIVVQSKAGPTGLVVDRVSEVLDIAGNDIQDAPGFGAGAAAPYLIGIAKCQGRVQLLLDVERLLAPEESGSLS